MAIKTKQEYIDFQKELNQDFIQLKRKILSFIPNLLEERIFKEFLCFLSKWNHYSSYNILLLYMQFPKAEYVAGFSRWQELSLESGREKSSQILLPDQRQKGIKIFIPYSLNNINSGTRNRFLGYRIVSVFDVSQVHKIPIKECFSPYVPLKEMDFDSFLFIMREPVKKNMLFLPGNEEDMMLKVQDAYLANGMLVYKELAERKREAILSNILYYLSEPMLSAYSKDEKYFLHKAVKCSLFSYYQFPVEPFVFPELATIRDVPAEKLLHLFHTLQLVVQKCIFSFYTGHLAFQKNYGDPESTALLKEIEKNTLDDIENEYLTE